MFLVIEENPNCRPDERVFPTSGTSRTVKKLNVKKPGGGEGWHEVIGVGSDKSFQPAQALQMEDSSAGVAWLIFGGDWGLRFKSNDQPWSLDDTQQWGEPFLVLDISGTAIQFE